MFIRQATLRAAFPQSYLPNSQSYFSIFHAHYSKFRAWSITNLAKMTDNTLKLKVQKKIVQERSVRNLVEKRWQNWDDSLVLLQFRTETFLPGQFQQALFMLVATTHKVMYHCILRTVHILCINSKLNYILFLISATV